MDTDLIKTHDRVADDRTIVVLYAKRAMAPYAGYFHRSGDIFIALALPGGWTGFGLTSDDACKMARARAMGSIERAKRFGLDPAEWFDGMLTRIPPALNRIINEFMKDATNMDGDTSPRFVKAPSDPLPMTPSWPEEVASLSATPAGCA